MVYGFAGKNIPMSGDLLQQKVRLFACSLGDDEFKASSGWLSRFKEWRGTVGKVLNSEASSANMAAIRGWLSENVPDIRENTLPATSTMPMTVACLPDAA